ncbi:MAG: hypothetical protein CR986_06865 [Ignavibacteriae bacterium]|nr:MAG: hypothetical protein CR986_06865 [Ignavibacteriota bacterium]
MKNKKLPLVSFVIPTHNRADILNDCLESVVTQTYENFEVIVVNDNSQDKTSEILQEYKLKYNFFRYYNSTGKGGNAARNYGIEKAQGKYIALMDDDDICEPNRIEAQMRPIIESNYYYNFSVCAFSMFNENGKIVKVIDYLKPMQSLGFTVRWLIEKKIIDKAGRFDLEQPALQDVEFFWRLKEFAKTCYIKDALIRVRDTQISITKNHKKMIDAIIRLLNLHSKKMSEREKNLWLIILCKKLSKIGDWNLYKAYYQQINKMRFPFAAISLSISLYLKKGSILKVHSKISVFYQKLISKYNLYHRDIDFI